MDHLLSELVHLRIGTTFNQYAEAGPDDAPDAPAIRLANLGAYLAARAEADVVCIGEAGGYQGMRWSGIAFTSERDLERWGEPYQPTCAARRWSEPSGTIVHRVLGELEAEGRVVLWNTVPTHPHAPGKPLSNRRPTTAEIAAGAPLAMRLIELVQPRTSSPSDGLPSRSCLRDRLRAPPGERRRPGLPRGDAVYPRRAVTSAQRSV